MLKFDLTQLTLTILQWLGWATIAAGAIGAVANGFSSRPSADPTPWIFCIGGGIAIATSTTIAILLIHILRVAEAIQRQTAKD